VPGILWNVDEEREAVEATGVYRGVIKKDMIDTVREVKRSFIDVFIEDLFFEDVDYPLTFVPMVNMVLPLKEGQEVWVYFNQQNHRYPVLWKLADKFDGAVDSIDENFEFLLSPADGVFSMPEAEETREVYKVSDSMWVICTESYCVMHYGDSCVLMNAGGVYTNASAANAVVNDFNLNVLTKLVAQVKDLQLYLGPQRVSIGEDVEGSALDAPVEVAVGENSDIGLSSKSGLNLHFDKAVMVSTKEGYTMSVDGDLSIDVGGKVNINSSGCTINNVLEVK
jgi:hypothetical protein